MAKCCRNHRNLEVGDEYIVQMLVDNVLNENGTNNHNPENRGLKFGAFCLELFISQMRKIKGKIARTRYVAIQELRRLKIRRRNNRIYGACRAV